MGVRRVCAARVVFHSTLCDAETDADSCAMQFPSACRNGAWKAMACLSMPRGFHRCASRLPTVQVFDGVLSRNCLAELTAPPNYDIGPDIYRRSDGSSSPQEVLIESLLTSLSFESTREVEWWGRSEWKTVEAHRDVDEEAATARSERRYPTHSIVVYLSIEPGLRAPTCLWVPGDEPGRSALLAVPAVAGRMLVFPGELLHAVPCPTLSWLGKGEAGEAGTPKQPRVRRSGSRRVMVLNLWDDRAPADECRQEEEEEAEEAEAGDEESLEVVEFIASRVECEPRASWRPAPFEGPCGGVGEAEGLDSGTPWPTLVTFAHGADEPLASKVRASVGALAAALKSERVPSWFWADVDVTNLELGVPSLAGAREERRESANVMGKDSTHGRKLKLYDNLL